MAYAHDDTSFRGADGISRRARDLSRIGWDAIWRPSQGFIGPVEPPMIAWQRRGSPPTTFAPRAPEQLSFAF